MSEAVQPTIIFLFGPPGVGKSTLGGRACAKLGLQFHDPATSAADPTEQLRRLISDKTCDVVEIPWSLQRDKAVRTLTRKSGLSLHLWAHPEDMQARSGEDEPLFTPVPRLTTRSGFGRTGAGCREFRQIDRACDESLMLVDLTLEEAGEDVEDCIAEIREESCQSPVEQEGLSGWVENWCQDHSTSAPIAEIIVDAMAGYLVHSRATGTSPRTLNGIRSDLDAAGQLVLMYDSPTAKDALTYFHMVPSAFEFSRKFSDRPAAVSRYRRSLTGFAQFLQERDEAPSEP